MVFNFYNEKIEFSDDIVAYFKLYYEFKKEAKKYDKEVLKYTNQMTISNWDEKINKIITLTEETVIGELKNIIRKSSEQGIYDKTIRDYIDCGYTNWYQYIEDFNEKAKKKDKALAEEMTNYAHETFRKLKSTVTGNRHGIITTSATSMASYAISDYLEAKSQAKEARAKYNDEIKYKMNSINNEYNIWCIQYLKNTTIKNIRNVVEEFYINLFHKHIDETISLRKRFEQIYLNEYQANRYLSDFESKQYKDKVIIEAIKEYPLSVIEDKNILFYILNGESCGEMIKYIELLGANEYVLEVLYKELSSNFSENKVRDFFNSNDNYIKCIADIQKRDKEELIKEYCKEIYNKNFENKELYSLDFMIKMDDTLSFLCEKLNKDKYIIWQDSLNEIAENNKEALVSKNKDENKAKTIYTIYIILGIILTIVGSVTVIISLFGIVAIIWSYKNLMEELEVDTTTLNNIKKKEKFIEKLVNEAKSKEEKERIRNLYENERVSFKQIKEKNNIERKEQTKKIFSLIGIITIVIIGIVISIGLIVSNNDKDIINNLEYKRAKLKDINIASNSLNIVYINYLGDVILYGTDSVEAINLTKKYNLDEAVQILLKGSDIYVLQSDGTIDVIEKVMDDVEVLRQDIFKGKYIKKMYDMHFNGILVEDKDGVFYNNKYFVDEKLENPKYLQYMGHHSAMSGVDSNGKAIRLEVDNGSLKVQKTGLNVNNLIQTIGGYSTVIGLKNNGKLKIKTDTQKYDEVKEWEDIVLISGDIDQFIALKLDGSILLYGYDYNTYWLVKRWKDEEIVQIKAEDNEIIAVKSDGSILYSGSFPNKDIIYNIKDVKVN